MHKIAQVTLENEMDLILAHRRTMKLAELAGLSLSAQTTFATAVSEVSRSILESGKSGSLILNIDTEQGEKYIVARLTNEKSAGGKEKEGLEYAKRLVNKLNVSTQGTVTQVELFCFISPPFRLDVNKLNEWRMLFRNEPPISPYEELKRKNEQLQTLSENLQKSEAQYKTLTNSLPLIIFSLNNEGSILYANEWLARYTGQTIESLNKNNWRTVVHEDDYDAFSLILKNDITKGASAIKTQSRLKSKGSGEYYWHQISLSPFKNDKSELLYWIGFIVDIHAQKVVEETLKDNYELKQARQKLEDNQQTLKQYIEELNRSNHELQQFAFVASHDLQEPVRKLLYYSDHLLNRYSSSLDGKAIDSLKIMSSSSHRMRNLIKDLLLFSQVSKEKVSFTRVDLNDVAKEVCTDLDLAIANKKAMLKIEDLPVIQGDRGMMRQLFGNIISNSLKYSKIDSPPVIEISCAKTDSFVEIAFKDNGIGFDEKYLSQMFTLFQRLHGREIYEGTGLGLAICRKIVDLHQGRIWAEAKEGQGAVFYVSLPAVLQ